MKQFFKMMFASTFGVFIALGLFFIISIFMFIGIVGNLGSSSTFKPAQNTVYKIDLSGTMDDSSHENPLAVFLGDTEQHLSLSTLLETIKQAKENDRITGIYLEAGSLSTGSANLEALRRALIDFKESGKFIVAYSDAYTQGCYYLCSVADKVFLNPQGTVNIVGLSSQSMFYKGLMEKIGVDMEIFKVGTYKGAVEPYMLNKLSDENREQIQSYTSSIWNTIASGMAESRGVSINDINHFANEGLIFASPEKAVECGLIDELKFKKEAEKYVLEVSGQTGEKLKTASVEKMKNIRKKTRTSKEQIAIIYAEGEIMESGSSSFYDSGNQITESLAEELAKLKDDENIKAVVLRVNSPGGSAFISEQIWFEIVELKKEKPVVVSMGSLAASGGYYISCAADRIIAESNTLTGSIGVFGTIPIIDGALQKIGVTTDMVNTN
jgi:protease-4